MYRLTITLLFLIAFTPLTWAARYGQVQVAEIVSVYDADTFRVNIQGWPPVVGHNVPIRVSGIDAPEVRARCHQEKVMALLARAQTRNLLSKAKQVELREIRRGKYFRLLADVWIDGQRLSQQLITAGLARPYDGGKREGWCP
ncbi:MAG: thermonuclease family protein [Candidatus Thiodiazotropha sp. (ex Troendleina suluensis)]|nr:thermonuclease family protein [Candidatus Thiodiazotropha sp. (ex Troendleina suluensis)]